jgi:hypothetical protein
MLNRLNKIGASFPEYVTVLVLVAAAVVIAGPFIIRSWNANMKGWEDSIEDSRNDPLEWTDEVEQNVDDCYGYFKTNPCCDTPPCNEPCCGYGGCPATSDAISEWTCNEGCLCGPPPNGADAINCVPSYACGLPPPYNVDAQCVGTPYYAIENALLCEDDDIFLPGNLPISIVPNGGCGLAKCEVACMDGGFVPGADGCECPAGLIEVDQECVPEELAPTYYNGWYNVSTDTWASCNVEQDFPGCNHTASCNPPLGDSFCGAFGPNEVALYWPAGYTNPPELIVCRTALEPLACP